MQGPRLKAGGRAFAHIAQFHPELTALRRDLHAHPELGFEEVYTAARVKEALGRRHGVSWSLGGMAAFGAGQLAGRLGVFKGEENWSSR